MTVFNPDYLLEESQSLTASVFNLFFGILFNHLEEKVENQALTFKVNLLDELMKSGVYSKPLKMAFRQSLVRSSSSLMVEDISKKEVSAVIDTAYNALCELFGPIDADEYMGFAVMELEKYPEARKFSIKQFM